MPVTAEITVRLLERKSNRPIQEVQDWSNLRFKERLRRVGVGRIIVPFSEIGSDAVGYITADNCAVWIRYRYVIDGSAVGRSTVVTRTFTGPISRFEVNTDLKLWTLDFNDNLLYLSERAVNTDGVDYVDPGSGSPISAIALIRSLLNSELLTPTDGDRGIDIPARLSGPAGGGTAIELPIRWGMLDEAVDKACVAGGVGIRAKLATDNFVEFEPFPVRDQTAGSGGTVGPVSRDLTDSPIRITYDWRAIKSRAYVLGQGDLSLRTVREREVACTRLREMVIDARHLDTNDALDDRGDVELQERRLPLATVEIDRIDRTADISVGDKITVADRVANDATGIDIGPTDLLVEARAVRLEPGSIDGQTLYVGHEPDTAGTLMRWMAKRSEQSQFS